jgi:hypothetical protein
MLKKLVLSVLLICAILLVVGLESSFIPLYKQICEKAKDAANEECSPHNLFTYSFLVILRYLDIYNTVITALSTLAVAVFTYTLAKSTKELFTVTKIAADAATQSANAASRSAEALIVTESAQLFFLPILHNYWNAVGTYASRWPNSPEMGKIENTVEVLFAFKNYGKTPAILKDVSATLEHLEDMPGSLIGFRWCGL